MGFGKKGKLSLRYIGHYDILQQVGKITKRLGFCSSCVSRFMLDMCLRDPTSILLVEGLGVFRNLSL